MQIISRIGTGLVVGLTTPSIDGIARGIYIRARGNESIEDGVDLDRNAFFTFHRKITNCILINSALDRELQLSPKTKQVKSFRHGLVTKEKTCLALLTVLGRADLTSATSYLELPGFSETDWVSWAMGKITNRVVTSVGNSLRGMGNQVGPSIILILLALTSLACIGWFRGPPMTMARSKTGRKKRKAPSPPNCLSSSSDLLPTPSSSTDQGQTPSSVNAEAPATFPQFPTPLSEKFQSLPISTNPTTFDISPPNYDPSSVTVCCPTPIPCTAVSFPSPSGLAEPCSAPTTRTRRRTIRPVSMLCLVMLASIMGGDGYSVASVKIKC